MAEIDPVILQLKAEVNQYLGTLRTTTTKVDQLLGTQEKRVRQLEAQFERSSGQISSTLRGLAGTLATYFTGRELVGLIDNFTRLQNQLKQAGFEGEALAQQQDRIAQISAKYGASLVGLAELYGRVSGAARDYGASQAQVEAIVVASAAAQKIQGSSSAQAAGAMLGLQQAIGSVKVQAEEFNQIQDGMRPLLVAAAGASDEFGGSITKLRQAIENGEVSGREFLDLVVKAMPGLAKNAEKSALTLSGAFEALYSQLVLYVGGAASANGVTGALAAGIQGLANNLDTIIPVVTVLAGALGVSYVASAGRAAVSTIALAAASTGAASSMGLLGAATFALQARLAGAATTAEALSFALAGIGWPVAIALALAAAIYVVVTRTHELTEAQKQQQVASIRTAKALEVERTVTELLTNAKGKERAATIASMQASRARAAQALQTAQALRAEAAASLALAREKQTRQRNLLDNARLNAGGFGAEGGAALQYGTTPIDGKVNNAQRLLDQTDREIAAAQGAVDGIDKAIKAATARVNLPSAGGGKVPKGPKGSKAAGPSGPTRAEIEARFSDEMARLEMDALRARRELATDAGERADLEKEMLHLEREQRIRQIEADKDLTRAQKDAQIAAVNRIYGTPAIADKDGNVTVNARPGLGAQIINRDFERKQIELAVAMIDAEQSALQSELDIEQSLEKRRNIENKLLDLQQQAEKMRLEEAIAAGDVADATQARAQLERKQLADRKRLSQSQQTPGQKFLFDINGAALNINEAIQSIEVQGLERLNDGLVDAILNAKSLGDVFKNVANQIIGDLLRIAIQQAIIKPLAERLFGGGSGGGSSFASFASSAIGIGKAIFGRASGGYVAPGQMVRVNEAASPGRVEGFMSRDGGQIIPLGRMNVAQGGGTGAGGTVRIMIEEGPSFLSTIRTEAEGVSVQVVRAAAPTLIDASARETMARANRPKM